MFSLIVNELPALHKLLAIVLFVQPLGILKVLLLYPFLTLKPSELPFAYTCTYSLDEPKLPDISNVMVMELVPEGTEK